MPGVAATPPAGHLFRDFLGFRARVGASKVCRVGVAAWDRRCSCNDKDWEVNRAFLEDGCPKPQSPVLRGLKDIDE